jgi:hypothetical protein
MTYEYVNVGGMPNDGTGDPVRVAYIKINNNFAKASNIASASGNQGAIQFKNVEFNSNSNTYTNSFSSSNNLSFNSASNTLTVQGKIVPISTGNLDLGQSNNRIGNIYLSDQGMQIGNIKISASNDNLNFSIVGSNNNPGINLGSLVVTSDLVYGNNKLSSTTATTTTDGVGLTILSIPKSQIREGEFQIQSRRANSFDSQTATVKAHVDNNGISASYVVYGTMFVGPALTNYDVGVTASNVELKVSPLVDATIIHTINYSINN